MSNLSVVSMHLCDCLYACDVHGCDASLIHLGRSRWKFAILRRLTCFSLWRRPLPTAKLLFFLRLLLSLCSLSFAFSLPTSIIMAKGGKRGVRTTRNPELVPGVRRYGAVASAKRSATYKHTKKGLGKSVAHKAPVRADKLEGKFYASDDTKVALRSHRGKAKTAKLRKSIRAGTVVIVLAGRFRGKRVIVLKQLKESGMLLVTGQLECKQQRRKRMRSADRLCIAISSHLCLFSCFARSICLRCAPLSPSMRLLFLFYAAAGCCFSPLASLHRVASLDRCSAAFSVRIGSRIAAQIICSVILFYLRGIIIILCRYSLIDASFSSPSSRDCARSPPLSAASRLSIFFILRFFRSLQDQRCSSPSFESGLCDCHLHSG